MKRRSDRKRRVIVGLAMAAALVSTPAWAGGNNDKNDGNNASASSSATAISGANATAVGQGGSSTVSVTVKPSQVSNQLQGQQQSQANRQNQSNVQSYEGSQSYTGSYEGQQNVSVSTDVPRMAPPAIAPSLSVSSLTCYGTAGIGLSSPFGGVSGGWSVKDDSCQRARDAMVLSTLGEKGAALRLMAQDPAVRQALADAGVSFAAVEPKAPAAVTVRPAALYEAN